MLNIHPSHARDLVNSFLSEPPSRHMVYKATTVTNLLLYFSLQLNFLKWRFLSRRRLQNVETKVCFSSKYFCPLPKWHWSVFCYLSDRVHDDHLWAEEVVPPHQLCQSPAEVTLREAGCQLPYSRSVSWSG